MEVNIVGFEFSLEGRRGFIVQYHIFWLDPPGEQVIMEVLEDPDELAV